MQCRQSGLGFADPVKEIEWIERPGIGPILGLVLLYEIDAIRRFPEVKNFLSYSRLVLGVHESAGKAKGVGGRKLGNAHLKWAFSEAASLMLRSFAPAKTWMHVSIAEAGREEGARDSRSEDRPHGVPSVEEADGVRCEEVPGALSGEGGAGDPTSPRRATP